MKFKQSPLITVICGASLALAIRSAPAAAQTHYPVKTIRVITGSAPGGPLDFSARLAAQKLSEAFGQPVVVEPRTGASGTIANEYVAKAVPDGYTLGAGSMATLCVVPHLYPKIGYDSLKDFAPVTIVSAVGFVVVTHPSVPAHNLRELIALGKANPGKLSFGTSGAGSVTHLGIEMLKSMANVNFLHIPYKGAAPALIDLIGGQTDLMYDSVLTSVPHIKSGKIRAIAGGSAKRSPLLPEVPTVAESGLPGFEADTWFGIVAPAATPRDIVTRLNATLVKTISSKDVTQRLLDQGMEPVLITREQFAERIKQDLPRWGKLLKTAGIKSE
ncbi:MAG TPA: tripartite tricarboxylate transporter substrate binding protein [Burkholderiales bacterium]|nr:tripartite tricarboxylate transporter substrate binding protein [Burkholderiales bacterium]